MSLPSPRANHIDRTRSTKINGYSDRLLDERAEEWPLSSAQFHPLWGFERAFVDPPQDLRPDAVVGGLPHQHADMLQGDAAIAVVA